MELMRAMQPFLKVKGKGKKKGLRIDPARIRDEEEDSSLDESLDTPRFGLRRKRWVRKKRARRVSRQAPILDITSAMQAVTMNGLSLQRASESLRGTHELVLQAVQQAGSALRYASDTLRADKGIVMASVTTNGMALQYASAELRSDRAVVKQAITQDAWAFFHSAQEFQRDHELAMLAASRDDAVLECMPKSLLSQRKFALELVSSRGRALEYLPQDLRGDIVVVSRAVAQDVSALKFVRTGVVRTRQFATRVTPILVTRLANGGAADVFSFGGSCTQSWRIVFLFLTPDVVVAAAISCKCLWTSLSSASKGSPTR